MDLHDYFFKWKVRGSSIPPNMFGMPKDQNSFLNTTISEDFGVGGNNFWKICVFQYRKILRKKYRICWQRLVFRGIEDTRTSHLKKIIMQIHWKFVKCKLVDVCKMVSNVDVSKTLTFHNLILRERKMHKICWTRFERISTQNLKNVMNLVFSRTVRKIHSGHRPDRSVTFICTPKYVLTIYDRNPLHSDDLEELISRGFPP